MRHYDQTILTDEQTEAPKYSVTYLKSHSWYGKAESNSSQLSSESALNNIMHFQLFWGLENQELIFGGGKKIYSFYE